MTKANTLCDQPRFVLRAGHGIYGASVYLCWHVIISTRRIHMPSTGSSPRTRLDSGVEHLTKRHDTSTPDRETTFILLQREKF